MAPWRLPILSTTWNRKNNAHHPNLFIWGSLYLCFMYMVTSTGMWLFAHSWAWADKCELPRKQCFLVNGLRAGWESDSPIWSFHAFPFPKGFLGLASLIPPSPSRRVVVKRVSVLQTEMDHSVGETCKSMLRDTVETANQDWMCPNFMHVLRTHLLVCVALIFWSAAVWLAETDLPAALSWESLLCYLVCASRIPEVGERKGPKGKNQTILKFLSLLLSVQTIIPNQVNGRFVFIKV